MRIHLQFRQYHRQASPMVLAPVFRWLFKLGGGPLWSENLNLWHYGEKPLLALKELERRSGVSVGTFCVRYGVINLWDAEKRRNVPITVPEKLWQENVI